MTLTDEPTLDEYLGMDADYDTDPADQDREALEFRAEKLVAALAAAKARKARTERRHAVMHAELDARQARELEPHIDKVERLESLLQLIHRSILARSPKDTRIDLGNGSLTSKAGAVEVVYDDEVAVLAWALKNCPDAVTTPEPVVPEPKLNKADLRAAVKDTTLRKGADKSLEPISDEGTVYGPGGEVVPGVHVVKKDRTFSVETEGFTETPEFGF